MLWLLTRVQLRILQGHVAQPTSPLALRQIVSVVAYRGLGTRSTMKPDKVKPAGFSEGTLDTGGRWKLSPIEDALAASVNMTPLVPPLTCVVDPPCNHCHYCLTRERGPEYWRQ